MRYYKAALLLLSSISLVLSATETIPVDKIYDSSFPSKEKMLASTIDYNISLIAIQESYGVNENLSKHAKFIAEHIRSHIQVYKKECIDTNQALDYVLGVVANKFVDLSEYDLEKYRDSFYKCTDKDLTKRLYTQYEQKRKLPPKIEYGLTISLIGYFVTLIPFPPIASCGWGIMLYGANLVAEGYFSEQDKKYDKENGYD